MRRLALAALLVVIVGVALWWPEPAPTPVPARSNQARIAYPAGRLPVLTLPNGQRRAIASLLNIRRAMKYGDWVWNDAGVPVGPIWVRIDLAQQTLSVFRAGHEIGSAVILYGSDGKPTPTGVFPIMAKTRAHRSSIYDADMPFSLWLTGDGVAIHASDVRYGRATNGCIGLPLAFAEKLFAQVRRNDPVAILPLATPA